MSSTTREALRGRHPIIPLALFWSDQLRQYPLQAEFPQLAEEFRQRDSVIAALEDALLENQACAEGNELCLALSIFT
jgi:hypothetical protein